MEGIPTGLLWAGGAFGLSRILDFSMKEYPGEHSRAVVEGIAELTEDGRWAFEGDVGRTAVEIYAKGQKTPVYSGIIQEIESKDENGLHLIRLSLASGSILLDLEKKNRSYQDINMSYGQVISQALSAAGISAIYPTELDCTPIGFPVIQYQETDWEFVKRMGSRFGLSIYPEPAMAGAKLYLGIPETGNQCRIRETGYTIHVDRRFYEMGGERAGRDRGQFLTYEVESWENHRVGDLVHFKKKELYISGKSCEVKGGQLEYRYILSGREWAGARRISNERISGMSLLGTVQGREGETVRLKLDIDERYPEQNLYAWKWVPATGNVMYMMPQKGTRVSLYFKGGEESGAVAVNCIRSGTGCAGADYRDKMLKTESGMQLRLCQCEMGVETLDNQVMLDNLSGINIKGGGALHILAKGQVSIEGNQVSISGAEGVEACEGTVNIINGSSNVTVKSKITLTSEGSEANADKRGKEKTYYLAWEREDLSDPRYRYRDEPRTGNYDYGKLATNVIGGLAICAVAGAVVYVTAGIAVGVSATAAGVMEGAGVTAGSLGMLTATGGAYFVAAQALTDVMSGRVSSTDTYIRKAMAGSVVGFLSGASALAMAGGGLGRTIGVAYAEGFVGSTVSQEIIDGQIDFGRSFLDGTFTAVMAGSFWFWRGRNVGVEGMGDVKNPEAHNVVNYAKLKEQYRVAELGNDIVDSLNSTGNLPSNYITKSQAKALGWSEGKALSNYAPGKALGGDIFDNTTNVLPSASGRVWHEADVGVNYNMSRSNSKNPAYRILYSNDGLIYGTYDHYDSVFQIYP